MESTVCINNRGVNYVKVNSKFKCALSASEENDCVVMAFASAFQVSYKKAHSYVKEKFDREDRKGTLGTAVRLMMFESHNEIMFGKKIKLMGEDRGDGLGKVLKVKMRSGKWEREGSMTVGRFLKTYKQGTYLILVSGHAFSIIDGIVHGNKEDAGKLKVPITHAFKIIDQS